MSDVDILKQIVPPPAFPLEAGPALLRIEIEKQLGAQLPDCVFELGLCYGTGEFKTSVGTDFRILNPFSKWYFQKLSEEHGIYKEHKKDFGDSYLPYSIFPSRPGLFMCGSGSNRQAVFWLTEGRANAWPIVYLTPEQKMERFDGSLTKFLMESLRGEVPSFFRWETKGQSSEDQLCQIIFTPLPPFDNIKSPPPHEDAALGNLAAIQKAAEQRLDFEVRDDIGGTVLFTAIRFQNTEVAKLLLKLGADPQARDQVQSTPLICACDSDADGSIIEALLEAGAEVDARNSYGETALIVAARRRVAHTVQLLLQHGADPNASDNRGRSALHWARKDETIRKVLVNAGAQKLD